MSHCVQCLHAWYCSKEVRTLCSACHMLQKHGRHMNSCQRGATAMHAVLAHKSILVAEVQCLCVLAVPS